MAEGFTREWIRKKSEQMKLPFANCLRGIVLEELLYTVLTDPKPLELVLENDQILGAEAYGSNLEPRILFWTAQDLSRVRPIFEQRLSAGRSGQEEINAEDLRRRIARVINPYQFEAEASQAEEQQDTITWTLKEEIVSPTERILPVEAGIFEMTVPFTLVFRKAEGENLYREMRSLRGMAKKAPLNYYSCAPELQLGEWLYQIWSNLELISSMEPYDLAAKLLREHAVDGRRISEEIKKNAEKSHMSFEGDRIKTIEAYQDYRYMEKRWISYCKNRYPERKKEKSAEWKDSVELICSFSRPIWDCLKDDLVFIGDWMPELGRFM